MLAIEDLEHDADKKPASVAKIVTSIVMMNLIFSFDSILSSALALTKVFIVMATAIVISGIMMIWLADHVSDFLKRNRMYEVLDYSFCLSSASCSCQKADTSPI